MYVAYIDSLLLLKTTPFFSKTRTLTLKKDPFFKNQGPVKYTQKHHVGPIISHGEWGGPGGVHVTSQEKSLISGLSSLLLNHCQACQHFINYHRDRGPVNALKSGQFLPNRDFICIIFDYK